MGSIPAPGTNSLREMRYFEERRSGVTHPERRHLPTLAPFRWRCPKGYARVGAPETFVEGDIVA